MNRILEENQITEGRADKSYWDVPHSTDIEGFATDMSVNAGSRVDFKINVNGGAGSDYKVEIFRLGYYGGSGAREVADWTNTNATVQPDALVDASRGMVDAGNWSVTDSWQVPANAVSGVYLARLQRLDSNGNPIEGAVNQIPFVVRNDGETHDIVLQTSDTTWQAYNAWGGNNGVVGANLYGDANNSINWDPIPGSGSFSQDRAYAVSYNRPFITDDGTGPVSGAQDYLFGADYSAIYWLEKEGYDVSYISGVDTDRLGADYLKNYKSFISVGHDEYWSGDQRANVEEARDAGVNLLFWSGNECYWKTRWDTAYSADGTEYRTLVCYKETLAVGNPDAGPEDYYNLDPTDIWTGTWMDTRFHGNPLAGGGNLADVDPITGMNPACHCGQNQLTGQLFGPDGTGQFGGALDVPANYASLRVWRDTTIANGGQLDIAEGILGYEWDTSPDDILRPAGLIKLSETTLPWNAILTDQGNNTAPGVATHNLSLYRTASGSLVFGAGTTFWSWGLSDQHDSSPYGAEIANTDIQQFTINMFADMGIQPGVADAFLVSQGLKRASASTDTTPAVASIDDLPDTVEALKAVTITGTATDIDGIAQTTDGVVAAVEVSLDGGSTWKVAYTDDGWATWNYSWYPTTIGSYTIKARAIDDSLNLYNTNPDSETVTVTPSSTFSAFNGATPGSPSLNNEQTPVELGMRFAVDRAGSVTELKYWRGSGDANDTDVREGHLWRADGTLLATVTFTSVVGQAGWQVAALSTPVTLTAGTQYIVSYRTNDNYVSTGNYFVDANDVAFDGLDNDSFWGHGGVVRVVQDGVGGTNGVFQYGGGAPVMPSASYNGANYWVDIAFDADSVPSNTAPVITSAAAMTTPENRLTVGTITAIDADSDHLSYAITGGADAARFTINSQTGLLSFVSTPNFEAPADAGGNNVYDLIVSVSDGIAPPVTQAITVTVTGRDENDTGSTVFDLVDVPARTETADTTDYELGMRFTANAAGTITELRYFRGSADANDSDTRVLNLWDVTGNRLGSVTVTSIAGESGWQVGALSTPVAIQAGATYIVSYGTTQNYAVTANYFTTAHAGPDGVLTAGVASGVFSAGTPGVFPTSTFNASNYWADVTFVPTSTTNDHAPVITSAAALTTSENRLNVGSITATDGDNNPLSYAIAGGADAALFTIDAQTGLLKFVHTPNFEAPADAGADNVYDLTVSVSDGMSPAVSQAITVTVTDLDESSAGSNVFALNDAPATTETADSDDYELGMRFTANAAGTITELRYFRGTADAGDTDTRVLNLWDAAGNRLGSVTVTSTTGESGWQVGTLSTPVSIQAGATYTVSYGTTQNYAVTGNYFGTAHAGPDGVLTAGSGVFAAGTTGAFPTATFNNSNYWADVTFVPDTAPVFTSAAAITSPESRLTVGTVTATDANGDPLTYAIAGGTDAALFTINAQTGVLSFINTPNFEAPTDAGANNVYDLTVSVTGGFGAPVTQAITVTVTDRNENTTGSSLFGLTDVPTTTDTTDPGDYELGMKFTASSAGTITELRYFRGAADSGDTDTRVLNLWDASGNRLASVTVTSAAGESGWQIGTLSAPISIQAGATYVVSYGTTQNYAVTTNYFNTAHSGPDGVLTAGTASGVFAEGTTDIFPTTSNGSNYWADVTFVPAVNSAPVFTSAATASADENQLVAATLAVTDANSDTLTYAIVGGADAARFTVNASTGVLSFVSAPDFEAPTDTGANNVYDVTVGVSDGHAPAVTQALAISVNDRADSIGSNVFALTDAPATIETNDPSDYELGMRFTANTSGVINQLRYFRGAADANDSDTRVLNLWQDNGILVGSVTVTSGVGATGWQVGTLTTAATIEAGSTYVVSYGTTQNYAVTGNYFGTAHSGPDGVLTAGSGVFASGGTGVFPTLSFNAANYWVDVNFVSDNLNHRPTFTSAGTASAAENQLSISTLTATDPDGDPLTYAIVGGVDAARFTVNAQTGVLSFVSAPDFEAPADAGANNVYDITVGVRDDKGATSTQALAITVTNVNEAPTITAIAAPNTNEDAANPVQVNLLAGATDPEGNTISVLSGVTVTSSNAARTVAFTVSAAGVLSFDPAQFGELDAGQSELLTVSYQISDGTNPAVSNTATITVEGRHDNLAPSFTSPATASVAENQLIAAALTATDPEGDALNYAITGGADAARFTVNAQTGVLSFVSAPNFEAPVNAGANNVYDVTVSVSDGTAPAVTQALAITVTDTNEAPTIAAIAAPNTNEDAANPAQIDLLAGAIDPEGNTISVLSGVTVASSNAARTVAFTVSAAGVLSFDPAQFGELDAGQSEVLTVSYQIGDGISGPVSNTATITVEGRDDNRAPVFTSSATASVAENQLAVATLAAADPDGDPLTYAITGGADAARFTVNTQTGVLSFVTAPNFEAPADAGANNVYDVTVSVSDGTAPAVTQALAITVTNVNEAPTIAAIAAPNTNEDAANPVQINLLAGATDPEGNTISVLSGVTVTSSNASRTVAFSVTAGVLSFNPTQFGSLNAGQSETLTVSYRISDSVNPSVLNTATITVEGRDENQTLTGNFFSNTLTGGEGNDTINGLQGNDVIRGNGGSDTINGGSDDDNIDAGAGDDVILIAGSEADGDTIVGGLGNDTVRITGSADAVLAGTSQMTGIEAFDGSGRSLRGTDSANTFDFSAYTLSNLVSILALGGNDTVIGSAGTDVINGGSGTDSLNGGAGNDTIQVAGTEAQSDTMVGGDGIDTLLITGSSDLTLNGTSTITDFETLNGGSRSILGTSSANTFDLSIFTTVTNLDGVEGLGGNDTLTGSNTADRLDGGSGNDTVRGGNGDDTIVVRTNEALGDTIDGGAGTADRILVDGSSSLTLTNTGLITGIERLEGGGGAIVGTSSADVLDFSAMAVSGISSIQGLDGADTIKGGSGNDVLSGGLGNDTLTGGGGQDTFLFDSALTSNVDTIADFTSNETIRLDQDIFTTLSTGTLSATAFFAGAAANDSSDRIIYNSANGNLYYDRDGTGSTYAAVQFAHLNGTVTLSNTNFTVVS